MKKIKRQITRNVLLRAATAGPVNSSDEGLVRIIALFSIVGLFFILMGASPLPVTGILFIIFIFILLSNHP